jgi:hypothetical protein
VAIAGAEPSFLTAIHGTMKSCPDTKQLSTRIASPRLISSPYDANRRSFDYVSAVPRQLRDEKHCGHCAQNDNPPLSTMPEY